MLQDIYQKQVKFQELITGNILPCDDIHWFSITIPLLIEEIGEVLKEDKRWKAFRNVKFDPQAKKDELVDVFIVMLNLLIFSDVNIEEFLAKVNAKIDVNTKRLLVKGANTNGNNPGGAEQNR